MAMTAGFPEGEGLPERVGPYVIRRRIGQGGMGVVYQGLDPRQDRLVAIKVLRSEVAGDHIARARLAREVETMRRVHSDNVAEVIDADTSAELPWVVTEYVPGPTLDSTVTDHGPLRGRALTRFVSGLARAIESIHAVEVIHRDLKPGNVIISNGEPIVIDFGIAHAVDGAKLTQTGTFVGTPSYLSPEVIEGTDLGSATDIHAWGATVAFAATGNAPYGAGSFEVIFFRILNGEINIDGMPDELKPLVMAAVSRDMAARPTASQLVAETSRLNLDLPWAEDAAAHSSSGLTGNHTVQAPTPDRGRTQDRGGGLGAISAGAAAGAGAGALAGAAMGGETDPPQSHRTAAADPQRTEAVRDPQRPEAAHSGGVDQTMVAGSGEVDQMMVAGSGRTDQTMVAASNDSQSTGLLADSEPVGGSMEPHTQYYDSTLRPEDFRDILTPVDDDRGRGRGSALSDDYGEEEKPGFFDRFRRSGGDRLSDYLGNEDDDPYDHYEEQPRRLPSLILIPLLLLVAGLCLAVPTLGLVIGLLAAAALGALNTVKAEHARRLQTRGPRSSDNMVIALSMPWALMRNLGWALAYGVGYLLAGIVVGIVVGMVTGTFTANDVGSYALFLVVLLSFLGPKGGGARREAIQLLEKVGIRNIYVYWGLIVAVVLFAMLVISVGINSAPQWTPLPGPSDLG